MEATDNHTKGEITSFGTARDFWKCGTCSHGMACTLDRAFGTPNEIEERGTMPLAGGIAQQGYQCGILWGSALSAGTQALRVHGPGPQAETAAMRASQGIAESFQDRFGSINCLELTNTDWKKKSQMLLNFLKGGPVTCTMMSVRYAPMASQKIESALTEEPATTSCEPASCAAELVKRVGLSDEHAVLAAGFAGGIGFSGGACGALGAAVWIIGMECAREGVGYNDINPRASVVIESFLKSSEFEFECSEIVGRTFEDVDDHSRHVRGGGCAVIIEALAQATKAAIGQPTEQLSA